MLVAFTARRVHATSHWGTLGQNGKITLVSSWIHLYTLIYIYRAYIHIYIYIYQHGSQVSVLKSNNQVGGVEKQLAAEGESWYSSRSWDAAQPRPRQAAESMCALAPQHLGFKRLFWCLDCRCTSGKKLWLGCKIHKLRTPTSYSH